MSVLEAVLAREPDLPVMNADGTPGITASMTIGAKSGLIAPLAVVLTLLGVALTATAVVLIVYGAAGARRRLCRWPAR